MLEFGALPPEINSGRMYVGAGSGPLLAAAAAWDELAAGLQATAASYGSTVETLAAGPWTGPSSIAMAAAAAPYVAWINATGAQAEQAGMQGRLAAGAYETAFAATVPPPVIATNRALVATLIATNILGQNTAEIAAAEAQYMEMWAQDAAAMYAYAASSASASQLTPFTAPPRTTSDSGTAVELASHAPGAALGSTAVSLSPVPPVLENWNTVWGAITGVYSPQSWSTIPGGPFLSFGQVYAWAQNGQAAADFLSGPEPITGALAPLTRGPNAMTPIPSSAVGRAPVSGAMGKAALVGGMSVPQGWTEAAPAIRTLASVLPTNIAAVPSVSLADGSAIFGQMALSSLAGRAVAAPAFHASAGGSAAGTSLGGVVAEADPAAATIIVIPVLEDE